MFSEAEIKEIKRISDICIDRIEKKNIICFEGKTKKLFVVSEQYPGLWLEHVYDSILYADLFPEKSEIAKNVLELFMNKQSKEGQLPCFVIDPAQKSDRGEVGFSQIQECVSFAKLCLEIYEKDRDICFLEKAYTTAVLWDGWLRNHRMTLGSGLIEMFVGFDSGHDNSGRLNGMKYPKLYQIDGVRVNAGILPPGDDVAPIIAVDMNCNFYATQKALEKMALYLGKGKEAQEWNFRAAEVKNKLFELCYNHNDAFFYDVDKNGNQRKYLSSSIFHLFLEHVLDLEKDKDIIEQIYCRHIKNPEEFWTSYPFPSMAISDLSCEGHDEFNCWGYYSQGLIALRCIRWMDDYGMSRDFDFICEQWLKAWTGCYENMKLGQELDPITGIPTDCSQWYSSTMLFYIYAAKRLRIL